MPACFSGVWRRSTGFCVPGPEPFVPYLSHGYPSSAIPQTCSPPNGSKCSLTGRALCEKSLVFPTFLDEGPSEPAFALCRRSRTYRSPDGDMRKGQRSLRLMEIPAWLVRTMRVSYVPSLSKWRKNRPSSP